MVLLRLLLLISVTAEVDSSIALCVGAEFVVLAGQNCIQGNAHDGGNCQTAEADGHSAQGEGNGTAGVIVLDADCEAMIRAAISTLRLFVKST